MKTKTTYHHIYTAKRYVLWTISDEMQRLGDFKFLDILVFKSSKSGVADKPESFEELEELLKDCDKVYNFNKVETKLHGAVGYDIVINE